VMETEEAAPEEHEAEEAETEEAAPEGDGDQVEPPEEVEEDIIVPVDATFTGVETSEPDEEEETENAEGDAEEEEGDEDDNVIADTGASTGNGVDSLRAQGLTVAVVASFLALLV